MTDHPFSEEQLEEIVWTDPDGWWTAACGSKTIIDQTRWSTVFSKVVTNINGECYRITWGQGSTEYQDDGPEGVHVVRVYPHQVMTTIYKEKLNEV